MRFGSDKFNNILPHFYPNKNSFQPTRGHSFFVNILFSLVTVLEENAFTSDRVALLQLGTVASQRTAVHIWHRNVDGEEEAPSQTALTRRLLRKLLA